VILRSTNLQKKSSHKSFKFASTLARWRRRTVSVPSCIV